MRSSDAKVVAAEALIRWRHKGKLIEPVKFVTLAESTGLIALLTKFVIQQSCHEFTQLRRVFPSIRLAINISGQDIVNTDLLTVVDEAVKLSGIDAAALRFELTEHSMVEHMEHAVNRMEKLTRLGVRFALDDFGTGHSSLKYLQELPITILKIDKSFVSDMLINPKSMSIVRTIVAMASSLGLDVVAEGVETENQYLELKALGVPYIQGWLIGKPCRVDEFERSYKDKPLNMSSA